MSLGNSVTDGIKVTKGGQVTMMGRDPRHVVLYANIISIQLGADDFLMRLAQRDPEQGDAASIVASVYLPVVEAKRLAKALQDTVTHYEGLFGPIQDDVMSRLTEKGREAVGLPSEQAAVQQGNGDVHEV